MAPREYTDQKVMYDFIKNIFMDDLDILPEEEADGFESNEESEIFQLETLSDGESVDLELVAQQLAELEEELENGDDDDEEEEEDDGDWSYIAEEQQQQQTETPTTTQPGRITITLCRRCLFPSDASSDEESE